MATEQKYVTSPSGRTSTTTTTTTTSIDPREQRLRHHLPRHLPKRPNDLYLDHNSDFKSQQQRGLSLLGESGWVVVHGLGQAVPHAINLALLLQAAVTSATLHTNTSSVFLCDDHYTSLSGPDQDYYHSKELPAVHIKISLQKRPSKESPYAKNQGTKAASQQIQDSKPK